MNLFLFLIVASVSTQDLFSFAGIHNPAVPVEEVKFITPSKSDSIIEFPQPVKTPNGPIQFPSNCQSPFWQRFRHGPMGWTANASTDTRNQMREIFFNHELTRQQKEAKIDELVMKESAQVQEAYLNYKTEKAQQEEKIQTKHDELVAKLSPEARKMESILSVIYQKPGNWHEKREEVGRLMENVNENIRNELGEMREELKKESPWRHRWGRRFWGRGGRRWGGSGEGEGEGRGREEGENTEGQGMNNGSNGENNEGTIQFGNIDTMFTAVE